MEDNKGKDLMVSNISIEDGSLNMDLSGELARSFMSSLINFYNQNGGKNFLTLTVADNNERYAITIENCTGVDSPAEKISRLIKRVNTYKNELSRMSREACQVCNKVDDMFLDYDLEKRVDAVVLNKFKISKEKLEDMVLHFYHMNSHDDEK